MSATRTVRAEGMFLKTSLSEYIFFDSRMLPVTNHDTKGYFIWLSLKILI